MAGSVLTSVGNYQGRNIIKSDFNGADALEKLFLEYKREYYTIPSEPDKQFMVAQKIAYNNFESMYYSYSAPTSMGKSFIMRMFIKEQIQNGKRYNFAIIVPTKALINELRIKITKEDLGSLLNENHYHIVTAAGDAALANWKDKEQNYIFVFIFSKKKCCQLKASSIFSLRVKTEFLPSRRHAVTNNRQHFET